MVGHQAVSNDFVVADGLVFTKNRQVSVIIFCIFEYSLFVDTAIDNMIDIKGTGFASR